MSVPGFIVVTFRFIKSLAFMFSRSCLDFFTIAQIMSFSVRIPFSVSFSFMIRLPTRFLTISLAHSFRFVPGEVWIKFLVIRSPTLIPVSMGLLCDNSFYK